MSYDARKDLETTIGNVLREELPVAVPGLTKQAYEEIIDQTIKNLPVGIESMSDEELEKEASVPGYNARLGELLGQIGKDMPSAFGKGIAGVAGATLAGVAMIGVNKALSNVSKANLKPAFLQALNQAMRANDRAGEILRAADRAKVESYANTIFEYAPNVATDVNLLKGILANAVMGDSMDPSTIRSVMELEEKRKNLSSWKPGDVLARG